MLNYLKYELHKILKTKTFWILFIVMVGLRLVEFIACILGDTMCCVMEYYTGRLSSTPELFFPIVGIFLATKEFSSGYIKNIYKQIAPSTFILSKFITLMAYVLLFFLVDSILLVLANLAFGDAKAPIYNQEFPFSIGHWLTMCLFFVTSGTIGMAMGFLLKKDYIAITVVLIWMFSTYYTYTLMGKLLMLINPSLLADYSGHIVDPYNINRYLHFGDNYTIVMNYIRTRYKDMTYWRKALTTFYVKEGVFILLSYIASWLSLKFRKVQ